ncbi:MAG: glycosyl transferase family 2, partial [Halobaculum sp.]
GGYGRVVLPLNWGLMLATPWALAVTATLATVLGLAAAGPLGLAVPLAVGLFLLLGSREALGPLQPLHAVADAYLSLLIASVRTVTGNVSATWEIDESGRDGFT